MATNLAIASLLSVTNTPRTKRRQETDRGIGKVAFNPAPTDERIRRIIAKAATSLNLSHRAMPSGAGHDAQEITHIAPTGMIFVPSVGGVSHSPKEFTSQQDMANGANVLLQTVLAIDRGELR